MDIQDIEHPRQEIEKAITDGNLQKLLRLSGLLHGHYCPGSAMGVKAAARAVKELRANSTGAEEVVAIVETNSCFADGVQMVTGCSLGNAALVYRDYGKTAVTLSRRSGEGVRVATKGDGQSPLDKFPGAAALFRKVYQEHRGTKAEEAEIKKLWIDIAFKMLDMPDEEFFSITKAQVEIPASLRNFASAKCSACGEGMTESHARLKGSNLICLSCSGQSYYQLTGDGMSLTSN